jgi:hypothetical protein
MRGNDVVLIDGETLALPTVAVAGCTASKVITMEERPRNTALARATTDTFRFDMGSDGVDYGRTARMLLSAPQQSLGQESHLL